ncbi:YwpF-like family protein [Cytobacillus gottheilii]|uniref:YwpF-like family protein n=1 Tax=Cytobacillus gottheilii TaxID=859144 RepID=A0ABX8FAF7_9BACI|nr:YwpF-like family protein [Cytobacillus gottheilii]QVY61349.1 YwpF-like family protein [Cytobacillus gottheilii]
MKTFKLVSMQVVEEDKLTDIVLDDGLIINKEDENSTWLLEAYINSQYKSYFQQKSDQELVVQVVISKKENDPAAFLTTILSMNEFDDHISILFKGQLKRTKSDFAEILLQDLLTQGLTGEDLMNEFKLKMRSRPKLAAK